MKIRMRKSLALFMAFLLLNQVIWPSVSFALTSGPSQPEFSGFKPVGATNMVDLSSGDFSYNIPLFEIGGYPMNLSYRAGVTMEQEASWVGLGWSLNPGAINRNLRGLPDDFKGDEVAEHLSTKKHVSYSATAKVGTEIFGLGGDLDDERKITVSVPFTVTSDNYTGVGFQTGITAGLDNILQKERQAPIPMGLDKNFEEILDEKMSRGGQLQGELGFSSNAPAQVMGSVSLPFFTTKRDLESSPGGITLSATRSKYGIYQYNMDLYGGTGKTMRIRPSYEEMNASRDYRGTFHSASNHASWSFATNVPIPSISRPTKTQGYHGKFDVGWEVKWAGPEIGGSGSYVQTEYTDKSTYRPAYGYMYLDQGYRLEKEKHYAGHDWLMDFGRENDVPVQQGTQNLAIPYLSYDVFSITGQGVGGQFRAKRNDVGFVHDPKIEANSENTTIGRDFAIGDVVKVGTSFGLARTQSDVGKWFPVGRLVDLSDDRYSDGDPTLGANMINNIRFNDPYVTQKGMSPGYEGVYMAGSNEITSVNQDFREKWQGNTPVRFSLRGIAGFDKFSTTIHDKLESEVEQGNEVDHGKVDGNHLTIRDRQPRQQHIKYLTGSEATSNLSDASIADFFPGKLPWENDAIRASISRKGGVRQGHHLSQIEAVNASGMTYVYGIPTYNVEYEEAVFNVSDADGSINNDCKNGLVSYAKGIDNMLYNDKGVDNYSSRKTIAPYPTSFLLTEVRSPDYVDVMGDGVSDDDIGSAVKFNYTRHSSDYKWRFPYGQDAENPVANHMPGQFSNPHDDRANYFYGSKEIWYPHSIESGQEIAVFYTSDREDGLGVLGRDGGEDENAKLQRVDKIEVYSKEELLKKNDKAVPYKTIHFEYDYLLCRGIPNHKDYDQATDYSDANAPDHGKLTLKSVYFTYGRTTLGKSNPYQFHYADPQHTSVDPNSIADATRNPHYQPTQKDRWGGYKTLSDCANDKYTHEDYYTDHDPANAVKNASVWNLNTIDLPSGGRIEVNYEPDEYAYVQDKKAMRMLKISGMYTATESGQKTVNSGNGKLYDEDDLYNVMSIELPHEVEGSLTESEALELAKDMYLRDNVGNHLEHIRYRILVDLHSGLKEFVDGYVSIDEAKMSVFKDGSPNYNHLAIWVDYPKTIDKNGKSISYQAKKDKEDRDYHPMAWAAWDYMTANTPRLVTNTANDGEDKNVIDYDDATITAEDAIRQLGASIGRFFDFAKAYQKIMSQKLIANKIDMNYSWMRLYEPKGRKHAGTHRVKSIRLKSNWYGMSESTAVANTEVSGQDYTYTQKVDPESGWGKAGNNSISSGVATYEPLIGGEENPWRQLDPSPMKMRQMPGLSAFFEEPYGETFMPAPTITYAQVKVRNFVEDQNAPNNGTTLHQFYTSKDFPTVLSSTPIEKNTISPGFRVPLFYNAKLVAHTMTQGYQFELNNMNGRPRSTWYLAEGEEERISLSSIYQHGQTINYFTDNGQITGKVPYMLDDGTVVSFEDPQSSEPELGVDFDVYFDVRSSRTFASTTKFNVNGDASMAGPVPLPILTNWPTNSKKEESFRSTVIAKVIRRKGFVKNVVTYADNTRTIVSNEVLDPLTGSALVTKTQNEFGDDIYSQNYLARWMHESMGPAYTRYRNQLIDVQFDESSNYAIIGAGNLVSPPMVIDDWISHGDQVQLTKTFDGKKGNYRTQKVRTNGRTFVYKTNSGAYHLIDEWGKVVEASDGYNITVINSANKNQIGASIAQVATNGTPYLDQAGQVQTGADENVIGGSAIEYRDDWNVYCCGKYDPTSPGTSNLTDKQVELLKLVRNENIPGNQVNPFLSHQSGIYRPHKTYVYQGERQEEFASPSTFQHELQIDKSGFIKDFEPYYVFSGGKLVKHTPVSTSPDKEWEEAAELTVVDPRGLELESRNALDIYSATAMGYDHSLPIASAQNSRLQNFGFDGFEDHNFKRGDFFKVLYPRHFSLTQELPLNVVLDATVAHTGTHSLNLLAGDAKNSTEEHTTRFKTKYYGEGVTYTQPDIGGIISEESCVPQFTPEKGDYFISAWVREEEIPTNYSYDRTFIKIERKDCDGNICPFQDENDNNVEVIFRPSGPIIDGWQRIHGKFSIPEDCADCYGQTTDACCSTTGSCPKKSVYLEITLGLDKSFDGPAQYVAWFDDVRVFPADAAMTSYVYNPHNLKLEAVLDENNYASIYEYAPDGSLERTKKETERGIMTLSENRQHVKE